jgi:Flp pilus assembly protein TadG
MRLSIPFRKVCRSRRLGAETGSAMVEFALSAVILLTVCFGILGVALAMYSYAFVSSAARDATRYAIVRGATLKTDCTAPGYATCVAQVSDITQFVQQESFPGINPNNLTVSATWLNADGTSCGTSDSCKVPGSFVYVKVSYPYVLSVPLLPSETFNVSGSSQMVIAQ